MLLALALTTLGSIGCTKTPAFLYGRDLTNIKFDYDATNRPYVGVYPYTYVLDDPNNPFAGDPPSENGKWDIQSTLGAVPAFYSWATLLATRPDGESQFYSASNLQKIYQTGLADEADVPLIRPVVVRGYDSVLLNFPTSLTYLQNGTPLSLASLAGFALLDMNEALPEGWVVLLDKDGNRVAVVHQVEPNPVKQ
jgi:hypothetical protein